MSQVGEFTVRANNYFARADLQLNDRNFINGRWLLEDAASRGEGFNTNSETPDAKVWEADHDTMWAGTYTSVLTDRLSSVTRFGRIGESLTTAPQGFFNDDGEAIGFGGRDPFSIGQRNEHASYITGTGGTGPTTVIRTYVIDQAFSYFVPSLLGGEHTLKAGGGYSWNNMDPRSTFDSGTFQFRGDAPYNPADPLTHPFQFNVLVGPPDDYGYAIVSKDQRRYLFLEDKWALTGSVTLNLGLRWDNHEQTPNHNAAFAPRAGFAWDVLGSGRTVVRGGVGKFFAYVPVVHDLTLKQNGVKTLFPSISINSAHPLAPIVLVPDMITDTAGNPGVARLTPAAQAALNQLRDAVVAGTAFNANPRVDSPDRKMPYTWSWSLGVSQELFGQMALSVDYVANASRNQLGVIDINEPVNGVRPGVAVFDPNGEIIPPEARGTNFLRVLQSQTSDVFDGDYKSLQVSLVKRMADRWSGRLAYTLQRSNYVGIGNPDARRVWLDNDPRADYGEFSSNRTNVFAASGTWNPWRSLTVATVLSAISGAPINETVGRDVNGDLDNNDRPIRGIDDLLRPILSELDDQGRAVPYGIRGPDSFTVDLSFRYQLPLGGRLESLDFFFDMFNVFNRLNEVAPTGNRSVGELHGRDVGQFPVPEPVGRAAALLRGSGTCDVLGVAILGAALLCGAVPASAQMELGVIKGRVVDEAGKPIARRDHPPVNVGRGREVTITTDKDGRFYRRGLQVGGYELKVEHAGLPAGQQHGQDRRRHRQRLRLQPGQGRRRRARRSSRKASPPSTPRTSRRAAAKFEAAIAQSPDGGAAARQPGAGLLPVEAAGRGRRQPGEGGIAGPERRRRSSSSWAAPTWTRRPTTRRWPRSQKGLALVARPGQGSAGGRGRLDPRRGVLRAGQGRRGRGAVPEGARRQARQRRGHARHGQGPFQQGRRRQGARAVRAGRGGASGNAGGRAGGDVHQRAQEGQRGQGGCP